MAEYKGFVLAISFLLIFSALFTSMPTALQGEGETADTLLPIDPQLITDFADSVEFTKTDFTEIAGTTHSYTVGNWDWIAVTDGITFQIAQKVLFFGFWLGTTELCNFFLTDGTNKGTTVNMTDIAADAEDGAVRYNLKFVSNGNDAGAFIFYWNTTTYATPALAWAADELHLLHGIGLGSSAPENILSLLVSLLLFQLPDVPPLIGVIIGAFPWASIIFIFWYVIKETMPFV